MGSHRPKIFANVMLREIYGLKKKEATHDGRNYKMRKFMTYTPHKI
jgi:hypothetical protein